MNTYHVTKVLANIIYSYVVSIECIGICYRHIKIGNSRTGKLQLQEVGSITEPNVHKPNSNTGCCHVVSHIKCCCFYYLSEGFMSVSQVLLELIWLKPIFRQLRCRF